MKLQYLIIPLKYKNFMYLIIIFYMEFNILYIFFFLNFKSLIINIHFFELGT